MQAEALQMDGMQKQSSFPPSFPLFSLPQTGF